MRFKNFIMNIWYVPCKNLIKTDLEIIFLPETEAFETRCITAFIIENLVLSQYLEICNQMLR